jgi:hypothetical protein
MIIWKFFLLIAVYDHTMLPLWSTTERQSSVSENSDPLLAPEPPDMHTVGG